MTSPFQGKVCVITGAASGIGRALAVKLASQGALLALSDVNEDELEQTRQLVGAEANHIRVDRLDVSDADAIAAYPALVEDSLGTADYVFNVAGLTRMGEFVDTPLSSVEKIMDVNFWGVVRMTKAFLPHLLKTKGGVVNISSLFGLIGFPGQAHYCASKHAVRGFNESLAMELEPQGVSVTSVHPGGVATNIARNAEVDALTPRMESREQAVEDFDKVAKTSPEKAADIILRGTAKRKRRVLVGNDAHLISSIQRLLPASYGNVMRRFLGPNVDI